jgi:hypothetical protein
MRSTKMCRILVVAMGLMFLMGGPVEAIMGTVFTYQGRLMDANSPAEGIYDFQFSLYNTNDPCVGNQEGNTVDINDLDVINGYFTAELDFGSDLFDGDRIWLGIAVRPGDSNDPDAFVSLSPRQEVTPTPYALQSRGIFVDDTGKVGIGTKEPGFRLEVVSSGYTDGMRVTSSDADQLFRIRENSDGSCQIQVSDSEGEVGVQIHGAGNSYFNLGNVGIGTTVPGFRLEVKSAGEADGMRVTGSGGSQLFRVRQNSDGSCETQVSDNAGAAAVMLRGGGNSYFNSGNVGIGTTVPGFRLEVKSASEGDGMRVTSSGGSRLFRVRQNSDGSCETQVSDGAGLVTVMLRGAGNSYFNSGNVGIGTTSPGAKLDVAGMARVEAIQITGADVAEKFPVSEEVKPGMVVTIDTENPGQLCLSRGAYNRRVAGVVSGANNLPAGAVLGNLPGHEDAVPIALSGRVWVYCDATEKAIEPGDMLTTSLRAGHATAVTDFTKAHGAVLGKAMTSLDKGQTGLVLTLINLQ